MAKRPDDDRAAGPTPDERERLTAIRGAESLADLVEITGAEGEHDAYFAAKEDWFDLRGVELAPSSAGSGLPGERVHVDGQPFVVHGITHADTAAERDFLQDHVGRYLAAGDDVYCEQGIRSMYFGTWEDACAIDDYSWAKARSAELGGESTFGGSEFDSLVDDVASVASEFRDTVFSLIESGSEVYGEAFATALGDLASDFLMNHGDVATAKDFRSFALSNRAAENPGELADLQRYYERAFLPQPLEREWLRRHDPELELVTHARNARMADYAVYHADGDEVVHLVVGAAHQPGVRYYLERFRDGARQLSGFEPVD
jgi:hypothetical protein